MSGITSTTPAESAQTAAVGEPAWVRRGSAQVQQDYQVALGFEQVLAQQLTSAMVEAGGLGGEGSSPEGESNGGEESSGGTAGLGALSALLPQSLASGVAGAGGLGLAAQLTREAMSVQGGAHPAAVDPAGGSAAPAGGAAA